MTTRLDGKIALITGASSGLGKATAVLFAELGALVAITGRNEGNLKKTADMCLQKAPANQPFLFTADLSNEDETRRLMEETIKYFGKLDILVNSAGILASGSIESTSLQDYDNLMNINCRSVFHLITLAAPHLAKAKGNIVNVSSVTGMRSFPGIISYCMSKSAIDQLTRCCALELASKQIRVNAVNPGVIKTEVHLRSGKTEEEYSKFLKHCETTHALGRYGEAEEVASVIAFLASDGASFITGATIPVDGGRHAMCPR